MNTSAGTSAPSGPPPPRERLQRSSAGSVPQVDDRLVVHLDLARLHRAGQLLLQARALRRPDAHGGLEHLDAALARVLRHVHGDVGVAQQVFGGSRPSRCATPTLAPIRTSWPATVNGRRSDLHDPLADGLRCSGAAVRHDRELVAAQPGRRVPGAARTRAAAARPSAAARRPPAWPSVSLTFLKPSRSTRITATRRVARRQRLRAAGRAAARGWPGRSAGRGGPGG